MRDRIKMLRKALNKTQADFGLELGFAATSAASWEKKDAQEPSNLAKNMMERVYNVNLHWLETGEGEMFRTSEVNFLDGLADKYRLSALDRSIIQGFIELSPEQRDAFLSIARKLFRSADHNRNTIEMPTRFEVEQHAIKPDNEKHA